MEIYIRDLNNQLIKKFGDPNTGSQDLSLGNMYEYYQFYLETKPVKTEIIDNLFTQKDLYHVKKMNFIKEAIKSNFNLTEDQFHQGCYQDHSTTLQENLHLPERSVVYQDAVKTYFKDKEQKFCNVCGYVDSGEARQIVHIVDLKKDICNLCMEIQTNLHKIEFSKIITIDGVNQANILS